MILPNKKDAVHKMWLYRTLSAISDAKPLMDKLYFKGGTCAAMRGHLDRFSVDLDFDYVGEKKDMKETKKNLEEVFKNLDMEIKDKSSNVPQYFLRYPAKAGERNTLKIDITFPPPKANKYESVRFAEIDRIINCQDIETMFANKLVVLIDRWEKNNSIAGRDLYDIHYFFTQGFKYNKEVIKERRKQEVSDFFTDLIRFVKDKITETIIDQDLNTLLPYEKFRKIRKIIKQETLMFLNDELSRIKNE